MTFTGKPSLGCETCRKVHVKCDGTRPNCSRCVRLKKVCGGYRDETELLFRAHCGWQPSTPKARLRKSEQNYDFVIQDVTDIRPPLSINQCLLPSKDDQTLYYFYEATFATLGELDHSFWLHRQLPGLFSNSRRGSPLTLAVQAMSYAVWAKSRRNDTHAMLLSRKRYLQSISALRAAIQDPVDLKSDETLYAILLLSGYETTTFDTDVLSAWDWHVNGAIALLRLRGKGQLLTPLQRKMFLFIRRNAVQHHIQLSRPVDSIFDELADSTFAFDHPEDRLISSTMKVPYVQSRANVVLLRLGDVNDMELSELILNVEALDNDLETWAQQVPAAWSYSVGDTSQHTKFCSGYIPYETHQYPDFYIARVWNLYRVSRLLNLSVLTRIASCSSAAPAWHFLDHNKLGKTKCDLVDDVCASVPFLLGYDTTTQGDYISTAFTQVNRHVWPQISTPKVAESQLTGRFSLIWPLYVCCSISGTPDAQREWMQAQLQWIADQGEPQAKLVVGAQSQTVLGLPESSGFDCV